MKRLQPVIWTKGTFLSPQHLQLQDRFLENLLQFHLDSLSFRPWGFRSLQISREGSGRRIARYFERFRHFPGRTALRYSGLRFGAASQIAGRLF